MKTVSKSTKPLRWSFLLVINRLVDEWVMNYDANGAALKRHWANKSSFDPLMNVSLETSRSTITIDSLAANFYFKVSTEIYQISISI